MLYKTDIFAYGRVVDGYGAIRHVTLGLWYILPSITAKHMTSAHAYGKLDDRCEEYTHPFGSAFCYF